MVHRRFTQSETAGGAVVLGAALVALAWANSPWAGSYRSLWHADVAVRIGRYDLPEDLRGWVNDALMAVFFFVVGLEIKRELVLGELRDRRTAALPAIAALGGMVVPAALFLLVNAGGPGARGWGIPMATDIAFAVGLVAVLGARVPASLKLFLLTLAVVDDIGAIVVIAVFYPSGVRPGFLAVAAAIVLAVLALPHAGVIRFVPYAALAAGLWLATYLSGVHATIAGVVLGLLTPARGRGSLAEHVGPLLAPWSTFAVLPVFALANAGVEVRADAFRAPGAAAVTAGVVVGLVVGKVLGISGAAWLAVRTGVGRAPKGVDWPMMVAVAAVAGIGFTVSLFVAELAFAGGPLEDPARLGVLAASLVAAVLGGTALWWACRARAPQA